MFSKAERVLDSQGRYEGQDTLTNTDMNRVTRQWSVDCWGAASTGYTSHLLLSYSGRAQGWMRRVPLTNPPDHFYDFGLGVGAGWH